ncbi:quinolinate synthase NadA [Robiginitalea marina]|uniref:Quinolinate synthase n=1 Tax=Robiginitalea marina TaxID=2954105 RepID=A0ABT1B0T4_9FLAO|nr:quinolinate synthase NadA [Robiginitalea marina]MCO5725023.1 quinolinate synthase NadA [Robiginitalea marina]
MTLPLFAPFSTIKDNPSNQDLAAEIKDLKKTKNAVLLAHYYQRPEIQDAADFVGDSLALSQQAAKAEADIIVFAGVHFMAETAKILNPRSKVLLPDLQAGCSLAQSCPPEAFGAFLESHPGHTVVSYINCSAEVKAMSDYVCTSSNALKIIQSIPSEKPIIFAPDKNLGRYLIRKTGRKMLLWDGSCTVHEAFSIDKLLELLKAHPDARVLAHPESEEHILTIAHYVGSTAGMIARVRAQPRQKYLVATEAGILHEMQKKVPSASLIPVPTAEDNSCACSECAFMKVNTLEKIRNCLRDETPEILVPEVLAAKAMRSLERMLELSV